MSRRHDGASPASPEKSVMARLLRRLLPAHERDEVMGDLEERYRVRAERDGQASSRRWYLRQLPSLLVWAMARRVGGADGDSRRTGSGWRAGERSAASESVWAGSGTDLRVAARALRANPGYAVVAVVTLALGIGGNTAVFSVVDGVLLRPLPFPDPSELVAIHETRAGQTWWSAAPHNVLAWRERSRTLEDVAWAQPRVGSLLDAEDRPVSVGVVAASANVFDLLQLRPHAGRFFQEGDDLEGAPPRVVLSHDLWVERYGASLAALGSRLTIDGISHTVIGVTPAGQEPTFFGEHALVVPRPLTEAEVQTQGRILRTVGRIADGIDLSAAAEEMSAIAADLDEETTMGGARGWGVRLVPLKDEMTGDARTPLLVLLGAVGFVLLIACANLSNLMLARGSARTSDVAVRASLGAGRGRIVRHLLAESLLIAAGGGALGLAMATWGTDLLLSVDPGVLPRLEQVGPDLRVVAFTAGLSVFAAVLFGLVPALRVSRFDLASAFHRGGARGGGAGRGERRLRDGLVAAEVALVVMLLSAAAAMVGTVRSLGGTDPGFETEDRLAVRLTLPASRYPDNPSMTRFMSQLIERVETIPGVVRAGSVSTLPLTGGEGYTSFHLARSLPIPEAGAEPIGGMEIIGPGYFEAMGIEILAGRGVEAADLTSGEQVMVVDEGVARTIGGPEAALTDAIRMAPEGAGPVMASWRRIVGVVAPVRYGLDAQPRPRIYVPEGQTGFTLRPRTLVVRVQPGAEDAVVPVVRQAVADIDPVLSIRSLLWLDEIAHSSISRTRFQGVLLTAFAIIALALGAVGVYGVVAYTVARRTREVGLRLALGASRGSVVGRLVQRAMIPVVVGVAVGLGGVLVLSNWLDALAFGLVPPDLTTIVGAPLALLPLALVAALVPGSRAARIDPVRALREE